MKHVHTIQDDPKETRLFYRLIPCLCVPLRNLVSFTTSSYYAGSWKRDATLLNTLSFAPCSFKNLVFLYKFILYRVIRKRRHSFKYTFAPRSSKNFVFLYVLILYRVIRKKCNSFKYYFAPRSSKNFVSLYMFILYRVMRKRRHNFKYSLVCSTLL
jgi:hypothetical protein